ncbi:Acyl transferase domain in polyketide synthase enzyme [Pseudomonas syringae pv. actinidiae]|uniref:Acyl transferase domain in polyketide synthase enzyme n=1 Tax=Pseudomonas syringae pv. actinidiae TaxID=103796 RepID=A0A2V0QG63_PSESF|nr:Acyl transferase domain in polyketide synthase enzyme [Pseudomonas syringae pv. actinidiae]GBH16121.1 Acyl transferase domain in polyketide synthase enzyme [Pseudomonas syringae pv. actinidiae]
MNLHTLGQQISCRLVTDLIQKRKDTTSSADNGFLTLNQTFDHIFSAWHAFFFLDGRQASIRRVSARCREAQSANTFGDRVNRQRQFVVLFFKHQVQRAKHRPADIPVKIMSLEVKHISIRQQMRKTVHDRFAILFTDTNIDCHVSCPFSED